MDELVLERTKAGLLENGQDSLRSALLHFLDMVVDNRGEYHHTKWVNVCAHHAAECISNMILLEHDPKSSLLKFKDGEYIFPYLDEVIKPLKSNEYRHVLLDSERMLFKFFGRLSKNRNKYMHRIAPDNADMSSASLALLGMLHVLKNRKGIETSDLLDTSPPIERDIASAIRKSHAATYERYVLQVMKEENILTDTLECCPYCDSRTLQDTKCWSCFEELDSVYCELCDESTNYMSWLPDSGEKPISCSICGKEISTN